MYRFFFSLISFIKLKVEYLKIIFFIFIYQFSIKRKLKNKEIKELILFYDLSISSVAYGDFFYAIYLIKILNLKKNIKLFLINDHIREDFFERQPNIKKQVKIDEMLELAKQILSNEIREIKIDQISWENAKKIIQKSPETVLFKSLIKRKKPIYKLSHNILGILYKNLSSSQKDLIYLNKNKSIFKKLNLSFTNFICLGLRVNYKNEKKRNIDLDYLEILVLKIIKKF